MSTRVCYFDCASGASGDMLLGALVDLGLPLEALRGGARRSWRCAATRLEAAPSTSLRPARHQGGRRHRGPGLPGGGPEDAHVHRERAQEHGDVRLMRTPTSLATLTMRRRGDRGAGGRSTLDARSRPARPSSSGVWPRPRPPCTARAPEDVHFHEVGAVDSIVDIVGGVIGLPWLRADRFVASPLNVGIGHGHHVARHVPGAAAGHRAAGEGCPGVRGRGRRAPDPHGSPARDRLRVLLRTAAPAAARGGRPRGGLPRHATGGPTSCGSSWATEEAGGGSDRVLVLETEIDDMSPQLFGPLHRPPAGARAPSTST